MLENGVKFNIRLWQLLANKDSKEGFYNNNSIILDTIFLQDGATPKQLEKHCKEIQANVRLLEEELERLSSRLQKVRLRVKVVVMSL